MEYSEKMVILKIVKKININKDTWEAAADKRIVANASVVRDMSQWYCDCSTDHVLL